VGTHGIWIEFTDPSTNKTRTATYLPEVALEQGWDKHEAVESLLRKGGFKGHVTLEFLKSVKLTRYKSKKHKVTYEEYMGWRKSLLMGSVQNE
jgi:AMME syndrome candidate gene 1 protein